jgi:Radical SAM superfamily
LLQRPPPGSSSTGSVITTAQLGLSNAGFRSRGTNRSLGGGYSFVDLVDAVSHRHPELRVRFTSPHPKDYPVELLQLMSERANVCNQLHLPAQSGSTTMLKRMKRGYSREAYLELIESVHDMIGHGNRGEVALSSDFIAGFCGETQAEHDDTVSLLQRVQYDQAYLFAYSMREKTHASRTMVDNVPAEIKQARLQELIDTFRTTVHAKNELHEIGKLRLVLVEGPSKKQQKGDLSPNNNITMTWHGRTDQNKRILFPVVPRLDEEVGQDGLGSLSATALEGDWMEAQWLQQGGMPGFDALSSSLIEATTIPPFSTKTTRLVPGDYAVVQVTEAKGHSLRGKLLWRTTLQNFSELQGKDYFQVLVQQQQETRRPAVHPG